MSPEPSETKDPSKSKKSHLKLSNEETRDMIWSMVNSKAKFQVFNTFEMYGRLSLTELADKMHKSKSTVHSHVQFFLKLGMVLEEKVAVSGSSNVFESYYKLVDNPQEFFDTINIDFKPFTPFSREEVIKMIEPAISMQKIMTSFFETNIKFLDAIKEANFDEEAVEAFNHTFNWVNTKEGKPQIISRSTNSFDFYSEMEFFKNFHQNYGIDAYKSIDMDSPKFLENIDTNETEKPMLIIKAAMQYGYMLEYLNTQKKKSYKTECKDL